MAVQAAPPDAAGNLNLSLHLGATRDELLAGRAGPRSAARGRGQPPPAGDPLAASPHSTNTLPLDVVDVLVECGRPALRPERPRPLPPRTWPSPSTPCVRDRRGDPADRDRGRPEHGGRPAGRRRRGRLRRPLGDVHRRPHAPASGGQGDQRRQGRPSRGCRSPPSPSDRPTSTGWLDDNAEVAFLPVDVVNDPTVIGGEPPTRLDQRRAVASTSTARWWPTASTAGRSRASVATRTSWPGPRCTPRPTP